MVRLGAINVTLESWHLDILDFIDLKKNGGEDKRRAKELFISISCSDLFMERVENNEMFTLFDPYDTRELTELWGTAFEEKYRYYEDLVKSNPEYFANPPQQINAKDLWKKFQTMFWETGIPFLYYKDTTNREFFKDIKEEFIESGELGLIRSANLCQEYLSPIKDKEVTVCNLGSVNLAKLTTPEKMERVIRIATRMLDNVIDVSTYQIPNTEETQKLRRSIGLGVCGEAEAIANLGIMYGSDEHLEWIDETYGMFEFYSDQASIDLGKEKGACKYSKHGYRNLHRRCIAPTSTISILMGTSQAHEAVFDKVWIEDNIIGTIKLTAPNLNVNNYAFYINAYEVDQASSVKATARRQKRIDMGISHNFYFNTATTKGKDVYDVNMLAYKLGFKTTYYTRSKSLKLNDLEKKEDKIVCSGCQN